MTQDVVVFDLDHTLVRGNLSFAFGRFLHRRGLLPLNTALRLAVTYLRHKYLGLDLLSLHQHSCRLLFQGRYRPTISQLAQDFLECELTEMLNPTVSKRLEQARADGAYIAILSASPDFLVEALAIKLQVDEWVGTQYACARDNCISHVAGLVDGSRKAAALEDMLKRLSVTREKTCAYTDSIVDRPLLESVKQPVAVAPDRQLRGLARQRGWEILDD